jgi:hypothetical protein
MRGDIAAHQPGAFPGKVLRGFPVWKRDQQNQERRTVKR